MFNNFSDETIENDFTWEARVISLICEKTGLDEEESANQREDLLLTGLISKAASFLKKNKPSVYETTYYCAQTSNAWKILTEMRTDILLLTSEALFNTIKESAIQDPKGFKATLLLQDDQGMTPFHWIARINNTEMLNFIAKMWPDEFKAGMLITDNEGNSPFHWAANNNNTKMVELMFLMAPLESKENLTKVNAFGTTPLMYAVYENNRVF